MHHETIKRLCDAYTATGRVALIYPRKRLVSLGGGRAIPYEEAARHIRNCLQQPKGFDPLVWGCELPGEAPQTYGDLFRFPS